MPHLPGRNRTFAGRKQSLHIGDVIQRWVHGLYARWIRPRISREIDRQRLKLVTWDIWGYRRLFGMQALPLGKKLYVLRRFLAIDWNVVHAHKPSEISEVCRSLAERPALPGECLVEAGCWQGGSSAKFSVVCRLLGYTLRVYDSFQGVEPLTEQEKANSHDFSGEYAAPEELVWRHLRDYGESQVCSLHAGWFADTLAKEPLTTPVRVTYIDCDVAKGTREVLAGVVPALVDDGVVFSQDYHIRPVRQLLEGDELWKDFGRGRPVIEHLVRNLARIRYTPGV
jgi:O-methyltransferase